jgi:hypothetical protein
VAFADDIFWFSDSIEGAQDHVEKVGRYLNKLGMTLNPRKSSSFLNISMRNTWVVSDPGLSIGKTMFFLLAVDTLLY